MDAPEGATLKPWGWQKQIYDDGEREVWIGFGNEGCRTSSHHHRSHEQTVLGISGFQVLVSEDPYKPSATVIKQDSVATCGIHDQHFIQFLKPGMFLEVYLKVHPKKKSVTDDTIRR